MKIGLEDCTAALFESGNLSADCSRGVGTTPCNLGLKINRQSPVISPSTLLQVLMGNTKPEPLTRVEVQFWNHYPNKASFQMTTWA